VAIECSESAVKLCEKIMNALTLILVVLVVLCLCGGGYGWRSGNQLFGYGGISVGTLLVIVLLILLLTDRL